MIYQPGNHPDIDHYFANKYRIKPVHSHSTLTANSGSHVHSSFRQQDQQFFQFVREGKYKQAYVLGEHIINHRPNNNTVATFCQFLKRNFIEGNQVSQQVSEKQQQQQESEQDQEQQSSDSASSQIQSQKQDQDSLQELEEDEKMEQTQKINKNKNEKITQRQKIKDPNNSEHHRPYIPKLPFKNIKTPQTNKKMQTKKNKQKDQKQKHQQIRGKAMETGLGQKQIIKNIINIKLNEQNDNNRECRQRYATLADNSTKKSIKLPWITKKNNMPPEGKQNKPRGSIMNINKSMDECKDKQKGAQSTLLNSKILRIGDKNKRPIRHDDKRNSTNSINIETLQKLKKLSAVSLSKKLESEEGTKLQQLLHNNSHKYLQQKM